MNIFKIKNKAFTLAEIMLVFLVIGIVASFTISSTKSRGRHYLNKYAYFFALQNFQSAANELLAEGCTTADVSAATCATETPKVLPVVAHTATSRGLCDRLAEVFNTVGTVDCTATATTIDASVTDFSAAVPNFKTTNGMRFYNLQNNPVSNVYTVYLDIDGANRKSILNTDVMQFTIDTDGIVMPGVTSAGANNTAYLSAVARYKNGTSGYVYLTGKDVTYREAACSAALIDAVRYPAYCSTAPAWTVTTNCANSTYTCEAILNKPGFAH